MRDTPTEPLRRVLIASANPLFARGLEKMVGQRWAGRGVEIRLAATMPDLTEVLQGWRPQLVIVDYDDRTIQRGAFLSQFITEDRPMQVMLVSLRESGEVVVYDRRTLTPAQAEDWLDLPWLPQAGETPPAPLSTGPGAPSINPPGSPAGQTLPAELSPVTHLAARSGGMKPGNLKHYVIPSVLTLILTLILGFAMEFGGLLPRSGSGQFDIFANTIGIQMWIAAFLFSLITVFVVYSVVVYRHRPGDSGMGANFANSNKLEAVWTVIPLALVIVLAFMGSQRLANLVKADPGALEVQVTAFQWGWLFEYPQNGAVKSNQLYLPVNRQVHLVMTSRDVIHNFWVPEFGIKQDILPGKNLVKNLRINPNRIGDFTVYCTELCGGAHAYMTAPVKVVSQGDFDAWIATKSDTSKMTPEQRGQTLVQNNGCQACHSVDGSKGVGPTWKGLAGEQVTLADGTTTTADDAYLRDAILDPNKHIAAGFPPGVMPQTYKNVFNDQQVSDIIAFLKTIK